MTRIEWLENRIVIERAFISSQLADEGSNYYSSDAAKVQEADVQRLRRFEDELQERKRERREAKNHFQEK